MSAVFNVIGLINLKKFYWILTILSVGLHVNAARAGYLILYETLQHMVRHISTQKTSSGHVIQIQTKHFILKSESFSCAIFILHLKIYKFEQNYICPNVSIFWCNIELAQKKHSDVKIKLCK